MARTYACVMYLSTRLSGRSAEGQNRLGATDRSIAPAPLTRSRFHERGLLVINKHIQHYEVAGDHC